MELSNEGTSLVGGIFLVSVMCMCSKFFVGGLPPDAWEDDLLQYYSQYGVVKEVRVMKDHTSNRNRGFGFVTMKDDSAKESIFKNIHQIKNKKVDVREMQVDAANTLKRRIFVGGIGPQITEDILEEYFKNYGAIEKITIMRDGEGKSRRFGFIVFASEDSLPEVLKESIHQLDPENKVEVRPAETRKPNGQSRSAVPGAPGDLNSLYAGYLNQLCQRGFGPYGGFLPAQPFGAYPLLLPQAYQYAYGPLSGVAASSQQPSSSPGGSTSAAAGSGYWSADNAAATAAYTAAYNLQVAPYLPLACSALQQQLQYDAYGPQRLNDAGPEQSNGRARNTYRSGPY